MEKDYSYLDDLVCETYVYFYNKIFHKSLIQTNRESYIKDGISSLKEDEKEYVKNQVIELLRQLGIKVKKTSI